MNINGFVLWYKNVQHLQRTAELPHWSKYDGSTTGLGPFCGRGIKGTFRETTWEPGSGEIAGFTRHKKVVNGDFGRFLGIDISRVGILWGLNGEILQVVFKHEKN